MIDNENQNNPNGERKTIDLSQSDLIKNCYFCAYKAKYEGFLLETNGSSGQPYFGLNLIHRTPEFRYELQGFVRHYAGCGFDYGNLPIPVNNKKE